MLLVTVTCNCIELNKRNDEMSNIEMKSQDVSKNRYYTHAVVSYASLSELQPLIDTAKHYAYILHDRDEHRAPHYHLLITFSLQRSYESVRSLVVSDQNTFTQAVKTNVGNIFHYFVHATDSAIAYGKAPYDESEVVIDDESYWKKRALSEGASWKDEKGKTEINKLFIDDLIDNKLTRKELGIKYGRDFIKNFRSYEQYRQAVYEEQYYEHLATLDGTPEKIDDFGQPSQYFATLTAEEWRIVCEFRKDFLNAKHFTEDVKEQVRELPVVYK